MGLIFTPDKSYNAEEKALMAQMEVKLENLLGEDARIVGFREGKLYRGTYVFEYVVDSINYHSTLDSNTELQIWDPRWIYQDVMSKFAEVEFNKILESYFPIKTRLATALFIKEDSWTGQDYKSLLDKRRSELFYDLIIKRDIRLTDKLIEHEINSLFRLMEDLRKQKYVLAEIEMEYKNVSIIFEKNDAMITIYQMKDKYRLALDRLKSSLK
ncbi:hypothetical protein [Cohnella sp. GCM10027633]|uniref:hypothetical protein n=1 Tax=unclassified Cohnella TaxID=2636738 RepID=UPI00362C7C6E